MPALQKQEISSRSAIHPFSVRKQVVELYESGYGSKRIATVTGLDDSLVRRWIRRYRTHGLDSLKPYWRPGRDQGIRASRHDDYERLFKSAYPAYAYTLESVASIARRYRLDYHAFKYHVEHHHPELVVQRKQLSAITY